MRLTVFVLLATASLPLSHALAADAAPAEGCSGPCLEYASTFDLNAAWLHSSDAAVADSYVIGPSSETSFTVKANDNFSIVGKLKSEPVVDAVPGEDQIFSGDGAYIDALQAQVDFDNLSIWAGKVHPVFGRASDVTPGLHGPDLADTYDLTDRLGGGVSYDFAALGFSNRLQASAFTVDRTILGESLFTNRGRLSLGDGGAGNTQGVSSVAAALGGCMGADTESCYDGGSFGYQFAARYQKGGAGSDGNELGILGSLNKSVALGDDATLRLFGEAAWFRNFDGTADNAVVVTGSGALELGPVTYSLNYAQQRILAASGADATQYLVDATAMYDLGDMVSFMGEKWSIGAGYTYDRADGTDTHIVGLKLTSEFSGKISLGN